MNRCTPSARFAALFLMAALPAVTACGADAASDRPAAAAETAAAPASSAGDPDPATAPAAARPSVPTGPVTQLPPNEVGRIMVLEFHRIGDKEGEFMRSLPHFRQDLQTLYEHGYRPVTMRDVLAGNIDIPAGTTPVVFTFDDSTLGQFYYLPNGTIDPNTMVGSWAAFREKNPAWSGGGVWCILPAAQHPSNFFGEKADREVPRAEREAIIRKKMEYLVRNNHEICNHTYYHARLDKAKDDQQVQDWIGFGEDSIKAYLPPNYDIVTFALPLGMWPKNKALASRSGRTSHGTTYQNGAILEVAGGPNVSPFDTRFNPRSVNRFIVAPGALERQIAFWEKNPAERYVSDGDPNTIAVPQRFAERVDRARWKSKQVKIVPDAPAPAAPAGSWSGKHGDPRRETRRGGAIPGASPRPLCVRTNRLLSPDRLLRCDRRRDRLRRGGNRLCLRRSGQRLCACMAAWMLPSSRPFSERLKSRIPLPSPPATSGSRFAEEEQQHGEDQDHLAKTKTRMASKPPR